MDNNINTYDPASLLISFGGAIINGYADGSFVKIKPDAKRFEKVVGADGSTARVKTNNRCYSVTLSLMQTSPANDVLSAFDILDNQTNEGALPLLIKDNSGRTVFFAAAAWIAEAPEADFSKTLTERVWLIDTGPADYFVGGNQSGNAATPTTSTI